MLANGGRASGTCEQLRLTGVAFEKDTLVARFTNGNTVGVDLKRYPRLRGATSAQRNKWRLIGNGQGIHWKELDEDLSVENLLFASARAAV